MSTTRHKVEPRPHFQAKSPKNGGNGMDWGLMHCVKRIFGKKMFFYGGARARLRDGGTRARFFKMLKMTKRP